ncbi:hypothetical protein [Neorhizobium galegae]|uniref:hypothetical protein n=1 Tax=Neorhizobium galegae TaxID=399 RepID=UPI000621C0E0|nr:hypothetical protein [Neorhizobium galegae]KAB1125904.1 hypothetical protein F4V90_01895 [Neorhizobium galegae]MCQ1806179.1 hypothetical protein [Neorhizobium galegae]CDZ55517.1 Hypothetical protein NGAL_HAMBI2566_01500 [Neorhizobium galegae bv. orientalis]
MRLADTITVTIAGEAIELRPSLACAIRLERRPGSFQQLTRDIMDGNLTAAVEVIQDHTDLDFLPNRILEQLDTLKAPLLRYVMACAGVDPDDAQKAAPKGKPAKSVPFRDHLQDLYKKATGWLGWSPEVALDATPAEIVLAYEGRWDMLKAIYGGGKDQLTDDRPLEEKFRSVFTTFGTVKEAA